VAVSKFTPATVIFAMDAAVADVVKMMVADTPVAALTVLERTIDGTVRTPVIAANVAEPVSVEDEAPPVVIVTAASATEVATFASEATVHVTNVAVPAEAGVPMVITRSLVAHAAEKTEPMVPPVAAVQAAVPAAVATAKLVFNPANVIFESAIELAL